MRRLIALCALIPLLAGCGTSDSSSPERAVSSAEASQVLRQVAQRAATRTPEAVSHVCSSLAESCDGMSSGWRASPESAPQTPPSVLCDIALPASPQQAGARMLVVTGLDATGRHYSSQVWVLRRNGRPVIHEPAFWQGIRYKQIRRGRSWSGLNDEPHERAADEVTIRSACTDPAGFVASITGSRPSTT